MRFNPVNGLISLVTGWFLMSFMQAAARCLFAGDFSTLGRRFSDIGLFRDSGGVVVNLVAIVVIGAIGAAVWFARRRA
jgi:hypothetical protein